MQERGFEWSGKDCCKGGSEWNGVVAMRFGISARKRAEAAEGKGKGQAKQDREESRQSDS